MGAGESFRRDGEAGALLRPYTRKGAGMGVGERRRRSGNKASTGELSITSGWAKVLYGSKRKRELDG